MIESDRQNFKQAMDFLRASYPSSRIEDDSWRVTLRVYWEQLSDLPWPVVSQAVRKAPKEFTEWFPSAGQLRQVCEPIAKSWKHREEREALGPERQIPTTRYGQEAYLLEADSPAEKIARYWEAENQHWAKHPEARTEDVGKKRFQQIRKILEGVA